MAKMVGRPRKGTAAKTGKSVAKTAMSRSKTVARTTSRKIKDSTPSVKVHKLGVLKPSDVVAVGFPKSGGLTIHRQRAQRPMTPVERAAQPSLDPTVQNDGTMAASDTDVLRIARAVAEHRKGLMDRLAK